MAVDEDWLSSRLRLCQLNADSLQGHKQGLLGVTVNYQSFPPPTYEKSSVLRSLGTYAQDLKDAAGREVNTGQELLGAMRDQILNQFAQTLARNVMQSARSQLGNSVCGPQEDGQGEEWEADSSPRFPVLMEDHAWGGSHSSDLAQEQMGGEWGVEGDDDESTCDEDVLDSNAGLPSEGSIDYPNPPPTSPLLPERASSPVVFCRNLKRGLANGFRPSPPPPTPKDSVQGSPTYKEDKTEFVARLLRSLSLECMQGGLSVSNGEQDEVRRDAAAQAEVPGLSEYAMHLSAEIIGFLATHNMEHPEEPNGGALFAGNQSMCARREPTPSPGCDLQLVNKSPVKTCISSRSMGDASGYVRVHASAEQCVERALAAALQEVAAKQEMGGDASSPWRHTVDIMPNSKALGNKEASLASESGKNSLEEFASALVNKAMQQVVLQMQLDQERRAHPNPGTQSCGRVRPMQCVPLPPPSCCSFAADVAEEVLRGSVLEAAKQEVEMRTSHRGPGGLEIRALLGSQTPGSLQVLQALLLWAAASYVDVRKLQLTLTDVRLYTQFCTIAQWAQLTGWTVGDLVESLVRFCEQLANAEAGPHDSALLEWLEKQLGQDS
ncbi:uncharacterized protein si:dkey-171c9.3 [Brienomyrus brachyistius]|uniref:uncharacterized protein si:dkey-171c9.3 n=1 Tax=Brienomyrus brachyistius TaxID=42636 RepID=UPI0020B25620|nr:uncharacterized protein si:dkey-171c9.3 [Brienomyrus brachyistius]XP_048885377.1 uncharacterized protein si:dkey-171c9.3 [Brienomyrus brachyistius]